MSILPTHQTQGFASSSTQPLSQNPNPSHGNSGHHHRRHRPRPLSPHVDPSPGPADPGSEDSGESSQKVTGLGNSNGKRNGSSQTRWRMSGANAAPRSQQGTGSLDGPGSSPGIGGRKSHMINGNHLLNFQYDPISRPQYRPPLPPPRRQQKIRPYSKDLFLQANYKFVVLDSGNDERDSLDPDKMLQWEDIMCVRHYTAFSVQCPICLEYPLCPQITSCGHIFCFPCVLQYLLMGDVELKGETFKRCPLCFVMISQRELCAVQIKMLKCYSVGDTIDFMLLTRQKDSYVLTEKNNEESHSIVCNNAPSSLFSKFTFTTDVDLSVRESVADLDGWLAKADSGLVDDMEKLPYVSAAMDELEKRKKYWNEQRVLNGSESSKCANSGSESCSPPIGFSGLERVKHDVRNDIHEAISEENFIAKSKLEESEEPFTWDQTASTSHSPEEKSVELSSSCEECKCMEGHMSRFTDIKNRDSYNFYQAVDGQNIILHPLNMKCLLHHWGSYDLLPNRLSGRILQLETVTQTESIRRRYRYLSHFSLTTTFLLCEIDISEILPGDALLPFKDEIKKRESERKRIAKKERKEKLKAEATAEIPISIQFDIGQPSSFGSPTFSMDDFEALGQANVLSTSPPVVGERKTFSNVTRLGFAAGHDSPSLKREGVDYVDQTTIQGTTHTNVPSFANMISKAKPVDRLGMASKGNEMAKKGKKSSQVLLSTAGGRRY